jgi:hypothetical protein
MRAIVSGKGAVFTQCRKHFDDASYPKYPAIPVLHCAGFRTGEQDANAAGDD